LEIRPLGFSSFGNLLLIPSYFIKKYDLTAEKTPTVWLARMIVAKIRPLGFSSFGNLLLIPSYFIKKYDLTAEKSPTVWLARVTILVIKSLFFYFLCENDFSHKK
jgi:uncharacterized membrane protein YoaT (DUF817 family)